MWRNSTLLLALVFALCACGAQGGRNTLDAVSRPVIQDLSSKNAEPGPQQTDFQELCLVLPLPKNSSASAIEYELEAYSASLIGILRTEPQACLRITTHSALLHSKQETTERTAQIARAVKQYLLSKSKLDPARIRIQPLGASIPLFANTSSYGREKNSRMELTVENLSKSGPPAAPSSKQQPVVFSSCPSLSAGPINASAVETPSPSPEALAKSYTLRFSTGRASLDNSLLQQAKEIAAFLTSTTGVKARIMGHTDSVGTAANNQRLSYHRALEIQITLLSKYNIPAERTEVIGYGEEKPIADNSTSQGRSMNRRVEIMMLPYKPVVRYAGLDPRSVVPEESASPVALAPTPEPAAAMPDPAQGSETQNYRQRLEKLAKKYGAREVIYSGGVKYVPLRSVSSVKNYRIEISVSKCTLWLYRVLPDGSKLLVRPYKVATAKKGVPYPKGTGHVTGIDYQPWWYPTARMVRQAAAKGRRLAPVPPGSRSNPMGAFKIYLSHCNNGGSFRIHGTNKPQLIGRRVSQGCIRMTNKDGLELARTVEPGTEVVVYD